MQKLYYSIREISEMLDEEQHILRYWEKEFKSLKPKKNSAGNRKYSQKDIELLNKIKDLLRVKKYTLVDAKNFIDNNKELPVNGNNENVVFETNKKKKISKPKGSGTIDKETIHELIDVLKDISKLLKS